MNLAGFYAQGIGATRDLSEAHAWYSLSAENGEAIGREFASAIALELDTDGLLRAATRLGELRALTGAAAP
jgi:TPR repeat protein